MLDARGYTITEGGAHRRFEVHAKLTARGVDFELFKVEGVNGSRSYTSLTVSRNLDKILTYLHEKESMAAVPALAAMTLPPLPGERRFLAPADGLQSDSLLRHRTERDQRIVALGLRELL